MLLDLVDDERKIREYEEYHRTIWPEILDSIRDSGILSMKIFRFGNRLSMILEVNDDFSFEEKARMDADNPIVQRWEELMWEYQQSIPGTQKEEKWVLADKIFDTEQF